MFQRYLPPQSSGRWVNREWNTCGRTRQKYGHANCEMAEDRQTAKEAMGGEADHKPTKGLRRMCSVPSLVKYANRRADTICTIRTQFVNFAQRTSCKIFHNIRLTEGEHSSLHRLMILQTGQWEEYLDLKGTKSVKDGEHSVMWRSTLCSPHNVSY
jgi:hypothetical protein